MLCAAVAIQSAWAFVVTPSPVAFQKGSAFGVTHWHVGDARRTLFSSTALKLSSENVQTDALVKVLASVREGIAEAGHEEEWKKSCALLVDTLGMDEDEAELCLADATSWRSWAVTTSAMARKYIKPRAPDAEQLKSNLDWLMADPLSLDTGFLRTGVPMSPAAYLTDSQDFYKRALKTAPRKYRDAAAFRDLLLKEPTALQTTFNCAETGCASECGNCWVSFELKVKQ
eukprot:2707438-Rhodomonas_salina.1